MPTNPKNRVKAYQKAKQLEQPSKGERLLKYYETIRQAAARHDRGTVLELIRMLESSLNFEANPMFAWRLTKLYGHMKSCTENQDFFEVSRIADELHAMWQQGLAAEANRVLGQKQSSADQEGLRSADADE